MSNSKKSAIVSDLPRAEGLLEGLLTGIEANAEINIDSLLKTIIEAKDLINKSRLSLKEEFFKTEPIKVGE